MKIQEADAKSLLVAQGLPVPPWAVAFSPADARAAAERLFSDGAAQVVIKAQVLVGGRGKAGGVKLASFPDEAERVAEQILALEIKGIPVRKVLVGPAADIVKEFYLSAVLDRAARRILLMGSAEGGVEIETVAAERPDAIVTVHADPRLGLLAFQARQMAFRLGLGAHLKDAVAIAQGLPVPPWEVAHTAAAAREAAERFFAGGAPQVVIKAQVLVGGRGKAGGVKLAGFAEQAELVAQSILDLEIKGIPVRKVLVGPAADIVKEFYLSAVLDRAERKILLMGSAEGGVEIEQVAAERPDAIITIHADPLIGLQPFQARAMAFRLGLAAHLKDAVAIATGLVRTMLAYDADLVEINPLAIVTETDAAGSPVERLVCLDAKVTLDDSALPRHPELEALRDPDDEAPADREAREAGLTFIKLDGTIGCMVNGAGLAMTTMDLVKRAGGEPANFLDIGGGARADRVAAAMRIILDDPKVDAILVNIFGGITRGDEVARGLIEARSQQTRDVPMVVRIVGTNAELAADILRDAGSGIETATSLDDAVDRAVALAGSAA
jgi:succinyl-CoA synthetase beta subunit